MSRSRRSRMAEDEEVEVEASQMNKKEAAMEASEGASVQSLSKAPPQLGKHIVNVRTLISFGIAIVILALAVRGLGVSPRQVWNVLQRTDLKFFVLAFVVYYVSFPARGERWRLLMGN